MASSEDPSMNRRYDVYTVDLREKGAGWGVLVGVAGHPDIASASEVACGLPARIRPHVSGLFHEAGMVDDTVAGSKIAFTIFAHYENASATWQDLHTVRALLGVARPAFSH